jgi:hypothetical protein
MIIFIIIINCRGMLSNCTAITDSACPRWRIRKLASKEMIYKDVAKGSDF